MGNRKNANKKKNLSKMQNKTSDSEKTVIEAVENNSAEKLCQNVDAKKSDSANGDEVVKISYIARDKNGDDTEVKHVNEENSDEKDGKGGGHT